MRMRLGIPVAALALTALACSKQNRDGHAKPLASSDGGVEVETPKGGLGAPDVHRVMSSQCSGERPPGDPLPGVTVNCGKDADCTAGNNGRCNKTNMGHGRAPDPTTNDCSYDRCAGDGDCKNAGPCNCDTRTGNYCEAGNCHIDADCGGGQFCGRANDDSHWGHCFSRGGYYCTTPKDDCRKDSDCGAGGNAFEGKGKRCAYSQPAGKWTCVQSDACPIG